jgi:hypothetical protein
MKKYHFVSKNDINDKNWDQLVNESPDGWLYQTSSWINLANSSGSNSRSFGVLNLEGELVGVFPLYREDLNVRNIIHIKRLHTGLSGPVMSVDISPKSRLKLWKAMFKYVDEIALEEKVDIFQVRLTTLSPSYLPPLRQEVNPLFHVGCIAPLSFGAIAGVVQPLTRVLFLDKPEDQLLMEMSTNCRAAVRQAERNGLKFIEDNTIDGLKEYTRIHKESWKRTGLTPHSFKHFEDMMNSLQSTNSLKLFFVEHEEQKIAAVMIHVFKNGAFYWGGCSDGGSLSLRPNNFLLWNVAKWAKCNGLQFFEIGQYYPYPTLDPKEYNVGKYKVHFGVDDLVPFEGQKIYRVKKILVLEILKSIKTMLKSLLRKN